MEVGADYEASLIRHQVSRIPTQVEWYKRNTPSGSGRSQRDVKSALHSESGAHHSGADLKA
jgi:hypothetical protein